MASNTKLLSFLCLSLSVLFASSVQAQDCNSETFSSNKLYSTCTSLTDLSSTLHWTYHSTNNTVDIAYRITQSTSTWVAWAINPTKTGMVGADAFLAYHDSAGTVQIIASKLDSYSPTIANGTLDFTVYDMSADYSNGAYTIYATLELPNNTTTQNTVWQRGTDFSNGVPSGHPSTNTGSQETNLNFLSGQSASSGSNSRLHRENIHGVLNAISWGVLLPVGVMIARYMKVFKSMNPAWFYLHITCQCSAYILGVAGWGLGLKLGSESTGVVEHGHRNLGITMFVFATLQVFALLLRPDKSNKYRLYWNFYHYAVGYSVIVLSIINIFKGFDILNPDKKWKHAYIGVIATLGVLAVFLEATTWGIVLKRRRSEEKSHHGANGTNGYGAGTHQYA